MLYTKNFCIQSYTIDHSTLTPSVIIGLKISVFTNYIVKAMHYFGSDLTVRNERSGHNK